MKISAKGVYAIEIMLDIMEYGGRTPVAIKDVAARRDISGKYAEQVVGTLNFAGLVRSTRGPKGGYFATEAARTATVGTILRLTENVLKEHDQDQENMSLTNVIKDLEHAIDKVLDSYTLVDILESMHDSADNYVI
ncbi:MAG: Rrf2 family transcriptional regulator [Lachnospiraceae bacterium]|nr:Rrf2 family transcriptional regulator [Lachnospiraceae bacterium]